MMGVTDTITSSVDEYISYAVRLGNDTEWRHHIAQKIAEKKHLIYNDKSCIHALEDFLGKMVREKLV
jgi:predicted O-linked N-acetylglucosamine transferase (SPINDLY family)